MDRKKEGLDVVQVLFLGVVVARLIRGQVAARPSSSSSSSSSLASFAGRSPASAPVILYFSTPSTRVDGGSVNAFSAAALTHVMRATVSIPAVASASVLHSAAVGGSVVGVVRPL